MEKRYNHAKHETNIYSLWEKSKAFTPKIDKHKKPFTIIMPPPNASDYLHIGHARFVTVEDIIIRHKRMKGIPTLWLPGADHAGIETQYVFEKKLRKKGKSRFDYDRDTLYKTIWKYVMDNKKNMESQLRKLGASCDFSRNVFTLDPEVVKIVCRTFKKLYDDGLIYRDEKIINYCPRCGTAFSQLEVNNVERDDPLFYLDYGPLVIATTRPETIFADVAVAVNPKDKRYIKLIGKHAVLPIVGREIPIISDLSVDPDFGTGALKVTPAHDHVDFEIGKRHNLSCMSVIDKQGRMINTPPSYIGMKVQDAREKVVKDLRKLRIIKKTKTIHHVVGVCYRDKGLIEPRLSKQWFLKVNPLTKPALSAINKSRVKFVSKKYEKTAVHWLKNLRDWNISRQIVWGIRIPAFRCEKCLEWTITEGDLPKECFFCKHRVLTQDTDTFDTWFSSGQWPFVTLKITGKGDFEYFYPTSLMESAYDILPFWIIRMIMLCLYLTEDVPFREVLLHGLVRDAQGEKISKSKGNVINPIEMSDKYGTDAVRMGIIWGALVENDVALSENNIRGQRNFSNKIWNIARYIFQKETKNTTKRPRVKHEDDKWILSELKKSGKKVSKLIDNYRLNEAAEELYSFTWSKFAGNYLEKTKPRYEEALPVLKYTLQVNLKLLHPFMPFLTEVLWQKHFRTDEEPLLATSAWPL